MQTQSGFSAPDADISATIAKVRNNLMLIGDPGWRTYTDKDIADQILPALKKPKIVRQPTKPNSVREISTEELMGIIQTRERYPGYRSDVVITEIIRDAVIRKYNSTLNGRQSAYGKQPFTVVPSYAGADNSVPDNLALSAIANQKTVALLPVTDFQQKKDDPMNRRYLDRYNDRHPTAYNSIVEPLDSFSAFAEVATTSTGSSNWLSGLLSVANTAATTYGSIKNSSDQAKLARYQAEGNLAQANLQAQMIAARAEADRLNKPNNMPLIIGGAVVLLVVFGMMAKK